MVRQRGAGIGEWVPKVKGPHGNMIPAPIERPYVDAAEAARIEQERIEEFNKRFQEKVVRTSRIMTELRDLDPSLYRNPRE